MYLKFTIMKKQLFFAALSLSLGPALHAQSAVITQKANGAVILEGKIIYERKINIRQRMTDESMKSMVPEFNVSKKELDFSGVGSIYKNVKEEEDIRDKAGQENNNGLVMNFGGGEDQVYKDYGLAKVIELKELGPKKYLIEDSLPRQNWKLEEEIRVISGYSCKKATTHSRDGKDIIAWYCEDIPSSTGPEKIRRIARSYPRTEHQ